MISLEDIEMKWSEFSSSNSEELFCILEEEKNLLNYSTPQEWMQAIAEPLAHWVGASSVLYFHKEDAFHGVFEMVLPFKKQKHIFNPEDYARYWTYNQAQYQKEELDELFQQKFTLQDHVGILLPFNSEAYTGFLFFGFQSPAFLNETLEKKVNQMHLHVKNRLELLHSLVLSQHTTSRFEAMFNQLSQGIVLIDNQGDTCWLNPMAKSILGLTKKQRNVAPHEVSEAMRFLRNKTINKSEVDEMAHKLFDGGLSEFNGWKWKFENNVLNVSCKDLNVAGVRGKLWVFEDVSDLSIVNQKLTRFNQKLQDAYQTNQKQLEQITLQNNLLEKSEGALKKSNESLHELNEQKDHIMGVVSHDLKSPLDKIAGLVDVIKLDEGRLSDDQKHYLKLIEIMVKNGTEVISSILDNHQVSTGQLVPNWETFQLGNLIEEICQSFKGMVNRKDLTLEKSFETTYVEIHSDRNVLTRILENLISNAIKYSPLGKKIAVHAEVQGSTVRIRVKDEGAGLSPLDQEKLFTRFAKLSTTPTAGESSNGLGLSIAQDLAQCLGGHIEYQRGIEKGSSFALTIPMEPPQANA